MLRTSSEPAAIQLRRFLAASKRGGVPFPRAWASAYERVRWPHETSDRFFQKAMLAEQVEVWRAAYENRPHPALAAVVTLGLADARPVVPVHEVVAAA